MRIDSNHLLDGSLSVAGVTDVVEDGILILKVRVLNQRHELVPVRTIALTVVFNVASVLLELSLDVGDSSIRTVVSQTVVGKFVVVAFFAFR